MSYILEKNKSVEDVIINVDPELRNIYKENWTAIQTHHYEGKHNNTHRYYNIRWDTQTECTFSSFLEDIFKRQSNRFKINYSNSFILQHRTSKRFRFYHSSNNTGRTLLQPLVINNYKDFKKFKKTITAFDILNHVNKQRPNTEWIVSMITATTFFIDCLKDFTIGHVRTLPSFIIRNKYIFQLLKNRQGKSYNDNLCFFRCLALASIDTLNRITNIQHIERLTKRLAIKWKTNCLLYSIPRQYGCVMLEDIDRLEHLFKININIYKLKKDKHLKLFMHSTCKYTKDMSILLYKNHFCFISSIDKATRSFSCSKCKRQWCSFFHCRKHERSCKGATGNIIYKSGVFQLTPTPLEQLKQKGVNIDIDYIYPFRIVYDFESMLKPIDMNTSKTFYVSEHIALSVSICSNVPGFTKPKCFITKGDSQQLVNRMSFYMNQIHCSVLLQLKEYFKPVIDQINGMSESDTLLTILDRYISQLPVIGYNSSKYDINLIKPFFIKTFIIDNNAFVIKKGNSFTAISTSKYLFLDMIHFLAPGFSYANYLKAYNIKERKGIFPYEYLTDLGKLNDTQLPPKKDFYSKLKDKHITDEEYLTCKKIWKDNNMKTLKDLLVYYNNNDTKPFIDCIAVQSKLYHDVLGLDFLKQGISIPGLTLRYLFKTLPSDTYFSLINEKKKDLHILLREQMVGGPSIVFRRYHSRNKTFIREGTNVVKKILGYDANALYLWAMTRQHATEHPIRRRLETGFKPERCYMFGQMSREWLEWMSHKYDIFIHHQFNGPEIQVGPKKIRVDGFARNDKYPKGIVFNFHGCMWHGHMCCLTKDSKQFPFESKFQKYMSMLNLRQRTSLITDYFINEIGVKFISIYECEWKKQKNLNKNIRMFLKKKSLIFKSVLRNKPNIDITQDVLIQSIESGLLFGLVQCDIHVPDVLRDRFFEMPPIFKNTDIHRKDIGRHMRKYCKQNNLLKTPRRGLIGSFFGAKILLITPLARWYLKQGLVISKIYQIVEYKPKTCFREFGKKVTSARRKGDENADSSILACTMKLLGNSAYGKTIECVSSHQDVKYVTDSSKLVNNSRFRKQVPVDKDIMEVTLAKSKVIWKLPLQIGFFVYQYAKLRMLEFYYECLLKFFKRNTFELCEMDTDSFYMALSGESLEDVVNDKQGFYKTYHHFFPHLHVKNIEMHLYQQNYKESNGL